MINPTREQVAVALFNLFANLEIFETVSRRPALWDNSVQMPALYMGSTQDDYVYEHGTAAPPKITLVYDCLLYINATDPNVIPDTVMNNVIDAVESALTPSNGPAPGAVQTLGGIVNHAWIEGQINKAPGYLDGKGMAFFTVKILVPS